MHPLTVITIAAAAIAAIPAAASAKARLAPEDQLAKLLEGRIAGAPQDCLPLSAVAGSRVIDGTAIVYDAGSTLWVNRPDSGASLLHRDYMLVNRTSGRQLCSGDASKLRGQTNLIDRGSVSLGAFVPYRNVEAD